MSGRIHASLQGRFGNNLFQIAFVLAYAEKHGLSVTIDPWTPAHFFDLSGARVKVDFAHDPGFPRRNEFDINLESAEPEVTFRSYAQQQKCLIYSKADCQRWFIIKPEFKAKLDGWVAKNLPFLSDTVVAHRRMGDYFGYSYAVVSQNSYLRAMAHVRNRDGRSLASLEFITEERPHNHPDLSPDYGYLLDFYIMMRAPVLLRGNSCFSWWAAVLGDGSVYSPVIDGLAGGIEHDVPLVLGNHPRLSHHDFCTELFLRES